MEKYIEFIAKIVDSTIWPIIVFFIVIKYKSEILKIFKNIKSVEYKDLKVELNTFKGILERHEQNIKKYCDILFGRGDI